MSFWASFSICEIYCTLSKDELQSPILTILGISYRIGAIILAEVSHFSRFYSPDKILTYAGLSPSTYKSRQLISSCSHMEKHGSRYLRYTIFNAAKQLVRLIYALEKSRLHTTPLLSSNNIPLSERSQWCSIQHGHFSFPTTHVACSDFLNSGLDF